MTKYIGNRVPVEAINRCGHQVNREFVRFHLDIESISHCEVSSKRKVVSHTRRHGTTSTILKTVRLMNTDVSVVVFFILKDHPF